MIDIDVILDFIIDLLFLAIFFTLGYHWGILQVRKRLRPRIVGGWLKVDSWTGDEGPVDEWMCSNCKGSTTDHTLYCPFCGSRNLELPAGLKVRVKDEVVE